MTNSGSQGLASLLDPCLGFSLLGAFRAMMNSQSSELYWKGGPFQVSLYHNPATPRRAVTGAVAILETFCAECHKQYFAFNGMINGRQLAYERFKSIITSRDNKISVGTAFPDAEQLPGKSTIAYMSQGELLKGLEKGGEFENQHAKALVVFMYHLWDENFRNRIADIISVPKRQVKCALMGDIRRVRHLIIHKNSVVPQNFSAKLELLSQIWDLEPGELIITEKMVHSLMEQINAIHVQINSGT